MIPTAALSRRPVFTGVEAHEWQRAEASLDMARITLQPWRLCEALTALGRCERRSGNTDAAARRFDAALAWARVLGCADLLADLLCERGELAADRAPDAQAADGDGDPEAWLLARACAVEAAGLAAQTSDPTWEVRLLLRASDLFHRLGSADDAAALHLRAMQRQGRPVPGERPVQAADPQAHPTLQ
ncbi:MAG: hypothetical protein IPI03_17055 [Rubrivivax sp.]|nr:hypothetical protein [Rubrivivax sp.]MBK7263470.1 hypothetical protein [Rubrivivax sp.]MBK8525578.1 hypothetical protein [Rubrivivax sp.]